MKTRHLIVAGVAAAITVGASAIAAENDDPVVGRVDGADVHQSDVIAAYSDLPSEYQALPVERLHRVLLDQVIDDRLIAEVAKEMKYAEDEEVQEQLRRAEAEVYRQVYFTRRIKEALTEEALKAQYDEAIKNIPPQDEVHARHILVKDEDEAKALIEELAKGQVEFAKLAEEKSIGPSASQGGDLGYFTKDTMVPEFAEAAFALEPGQVSPEPVQTQFGWHVIKVEDRRPKAAPTFEEMQQELANEISQQAIADAVAALREGHDIERFSFDGSMPEEAPPAN
jgi:peptidyl-prolyl cis-trans isomerase C